MGESATEHARLPRRPLLKPWYRLSTDESGAVLRYGGSVLAFEGGAAARLLPHLLPLLDGTRTVEQIASQLGEPIRPAVDHALRLLAERRLVTEPLPDGLSSDERRTIEFLAATDLYGRDGPAVLSTLARARASVVGSSPLAGSIAALLESGGVGRVERTDRHDAAALEGDLTVVAPAGEEMASLSQWNRLALDHGTTWLQVLPFDGLIATVGPVFVPRESACYDCYRLRRSANIAPVPDTATGAYPGAPAFDAIVAGLAANLVLRRLALGDGLSVGVFVALEQSPELSLSRHVLYRVPRCPACSNAAIEAAPAPWHGADGVA